MHFNELRKGDRILVTPNPEGKLRRFGLVVDYTIAGEWNLIVGDQLRIKDGAPLHARKQIAMRNVETIEPLP